MYNESAFTLAIRRTTGWLTPPALLAPPTPLLQAVARITTAGMSPIAAIRARLFTCFMLPPLFSSDVYLRSTVGARGTRRHCGEPHTLTAATTSTGPHAVDTQPGRCHNHGVPGVSASWARSARLAAAPIGFALAVGAFLVARGTGMFTTYAGRSGLAAGLMAAAALALVLAGLLASRTSRPGPAGDLAVLAGLAWFAPVWISWQLGPPLARSLGMLAAGFTFPLIFHLVLGFPGGRPPSAATRALVWARVPGGRAGHDRPRALP